MTQASTNNTISTAIEGFIRQELLYDRPDVNLSEQSQLLEEGYVDSMGFFRLIDFIEQEFDVVIQPNEIQIEHFKSIGNICSLVVERQGKTE